MGKEPIKKDVKVTPEQKVNMKQESFIRVVTPRVGKALKALHLVAVCASSNYVYTPEQSKAITFALQVGVQQVIDAYTKKVEKQVLFSLPKV